MNTRHLPRLFHHTDVIHAMAIAKCGGIITPAIRHAGPDYIAALRRSGLAERWASQVSWFSTIPDLDFDTRDACGLTNLAAGDRSEIRFEVMPDQDVAPWSEVRLSWPRPATVRIEGEPGVRPDTWWVSSAPVAVVLSPRALEAGTRLRQS